MIQEVRLLSLENVKDFAQSLVEPCKKELLERGRVRRLCWIFTSSDQVPEDMRKMAAEHAVAAGLRDIAEPDEVGTAVIALDLECDEAGLLIMLATANEQFRRVLPAIEKAGRESGIRDPSKAAHHVMNVLKRGGFDPGRILADYMRHWVLTLSAYAYVHQADAWTVSGMSEKSASGKEVRDRYAKDLADEPAAKEALIIGLETHSYAESISVPYEREKRGTGKVVRFLEHQVIDSTTAEVRGRLTGILRSLPRN